MLQSTSVALVPRQTGAASLTQTKQRAISAEAGRPVPHWGVAEVLRLAAAARERGRGHKGERDGLLVETLFDGALRVSEGLGLRPLDITKTGEGYLVNVVGKVGFRQAAVSPSLVSRLQSYAFERGMDRSGRFFPFNKHRAWQIIDAAADLANLIKPPGVGTVHILRHSGAIERMRITGNPRSVQDQLGHSTPAMTLRYFRTLSQQESLRIQEGVDFGWA